MNIEKEKDILLENIEVVSTITCSSCGATQSSWTDDYYASEEFIGKGWRATRNRNVYCPKCAKKKLKARNE